MQASHDWKAVSFAALASILSLCGAGFAAVAIQKTSASVASATPPQTFPDMGATPEIVAQGRDQFAMSCSHCHGDDAHGDEGPDLHNLAISNGRIAATIKKGIKGEMPSFAKKYDDQQIAALVSYLRTLR